jgi:hypothetical protein
MRRRMPSDDQSPLSTPTDALPIVRPTTGSLASSLFILDQLFCQVVVLSAWVKFVFVQESNYFVPFDFNLGLKLGHLGLEEGFLIRPDGFILHLFLRLGQLT